MILGIDLGGTNIRIGQVVDGVIVKKSVEPSPSEQPLEHSLQYLKSSIRKMMTGDVVGIGIGVPSVVDVEQGVVYNVANMTVWKEVRLKDILMDEFGRPVYVNNDSNCFVLGEKEYGVGREYRNIVGITLGTGVGAGVIVNSVLYGGRNTGAGEVGSLPYLDATFEPYCSSDFFIRLHDTTGRDAALKAQQGDASALRIWNDFGQHIGQLMQAVLFIYDPELIILGGGIAAAYPLFEPAMRNTLNEFPYPETIRNIHIKVSANNDTAILGAAALVTNKIDRY